MKVLSDLLSFLLRFSYLYSSVVMQRCWSGDSEERPSFAELSVIIETILSSVADYTELSMTLPRNQDLTGIRCYI